MRALTVSSTGPVRAKVMVIVSPTASPSSEALRSSTATDDPETSANRPAVTPRSATWSIVCMSTAATSDDAPSTSTGVDRMGEIAATSGRADRSASISGLRPVLPNDPEATT